MILGAKRNPGSEHPSLRDIIAARIADRFVQELGSDDKACLAEWRRRYRLADAIIAQSRSGDAVPDKT